MDPNCCLEIAAHLVIVVAERLDVTLRVVHKHIQRAHKVGLLVALEPGLDGRPQLLALQQAGQRGQNLRLHRVVVDGCASLRSPVPAGLSEGRSKAAAIDGRAKFRLSRERLLRL